MQNNIMNRTGHHNVDFFVGTEVEHTPAYGMKTLFVVGVQSQEDIIKHIRANDIRHIYFGANQSFPRLDVNDAEGWRHWEDMIGKFLDEKFLCTLDLDVAQVEGLLESSLVEYHNFIPMISIKLPYIQQLGYNATIKLDDRDFEATNPGVWCHSLHALQDRKQFTAWSKYTKDEIIK
jgi:hypothetical protein